MTHKWEKTTSGFNAETIEISRCGLEFALSHNTPSQTRMHWENVTCKKCLATEKNPCAEIEINWNVKPIK